MYTVIGHPKSRTARVIRMLEELGQPYDLKPATPQSDDVFKLNSTGKIPVFMDGDLVVTDSVAIITYLADKHGQFTHKAGTPARAKQDAITQYIVSEVDAALWLAAKHRFALPKEHRIPEIKETARFEFSNAMDHLTAVLGDAPFLTGDQLTLPDIVLSHCAGWAMTAGFDLPKGDFGAYLKRLRKMPAMERTMAVIAQH